jgi:ABC-2 type transport system ATP-binding protein
MEEAEQLSDYIIIMDNGHILKEGTVNQLLNDENGSKTVEFTLDGIHSEINFDETSGINWDSNYQKGFAQLNDIEKDMKTFFNVLEYKNLRLKNLECRRKSLDDLFTTLTGRHLHE